MEPDEQLIDINEAYRRAMDSQARYLLLYGGAGSGKSVAGVQKQLTRVMGEARHRFLMTRKVSRTIKNSLFALHKAIVASWGAAEEFTFNKSDFSITCENGNHIISAGLDDVIKLKSIHGVTGILIEEAAEIEEDDFNELDARLRGETDEYKQIVLMFNPVNKKNWLYRVFFEPTENPDLLSIRAQSEIVHTTYKDNKFIDPDYRRVLESWRTRSPLKYKVYCLGEWGELEEGILFKSQFYKEWDVIPADARGIIYCDPNLALKGEGDKTAIIKLWFSPSTGHYYVADAVCRSFSDPRHLLKRVLHMRDERTKLIAFDGNFNQESTWTNNVRLWCEINQQPYPVIHYKRYHVNELAKNTQWLWTDRLILFPPGFRQSKDGSEFLTQLFAFAGKTEKSADDAPDSLICGTEFITEVGIARPLSAGLSSSILIKH